MGAQDEQVPSAVEPRPDNFILEIAYTREQLRQMLRKSSRTLYRMERRGDMPPCIRIGNQKYYLKASCTDWLRGREEQQPHTHGRRRAMRRRGGLQ
jgi:predicted DNA-binding transcriptional regulator AlpA